MRRPTTGKTENVFVSTDGTNGGYFELWDVGGLDRSATNNVNNGDTMTDAYVQANGKLIWNVRLVGNSEAPYDLLMAIDHLEFYAGLACRYVNAPGGNPTGTITVTPMCEAGFMVNTQINA